jgi:predicted nucleic acid-binding Zn finger protein
MHAFINTRDGNCYVRTKLFRSFRRAASFCKCLTANRRFARASVIQSNQTENGWFVQYQPSNPARYADLYYAQYRQRELKGKGEGRCYEWDLQQRDGRVWYLCASTTGETYEVTECSCSCHDWLFRGRKSGLPCKHQHAYAVAVAVGEILAIAEVKLRAATVVTVAVTDAKRLQSRFAAADLRPDLDF